MKSSNNVFLGIISILLLVSTIPLVWFNKNLFYPPSTSIKQTINGLSGQVDVFVSLPIWLMVMISVVGVTIALLNFLKVTRIPRIIGISCILIPLLILGRISFLERAEGIIELELGFYIFTLGCIMGLIHTMIYRKEKAL